MQRVPLGSFYRLFEVPQTAKESDISAVYKDGILEVSIPLESQPKPEPKRYGSRGREQETQPVDSATTIGAVSPRPGKRRTDMEAKVGDEIVVDGVRTGDLP